MGLEQLNFAGQDRITVALDRLRAFEPTEGYYLAFSGGKDSVVLYDLAVRSGVVFDAHYAQTGIDPPELVQFIRRHYPGVAWEKPLRRMWDLIVAKGLPRRNARFCCEYLKEHGGAGRVVLTGIRWQESVRRRQRAMVERCRWQPGKRYVHPIIDWTSRDVWDYIHSRNLPYCNLYDEGFSRLGCVLCPLTTKRHTEIELARWPKLADAWRRAADRFYARGTEATLKRWASSEEMWQWWINRKRDTRGDVDCQLGLFV